VRHFSKLGKRKVMSSPPRRSILRLAAISSAVLVGCTFASRAEEKTIQPCQEDAMIVFDASGSMSGYETIGETALSPNSRPRIEEARSALARILPSATRFRRVGLVTYGPGPWDQCNVNLNLKPTANAAGLILKTVNSIDPAGKTPLAEGIEVAAEALDFRRNPGVVVVITDGEETCGGAPCELGKRLRAEGLKLTVHVIAFRYEGYTLSGDSIKDLMCVAQQNNGLYIPANTEEELVEALEKTLDCPVVSQTPVPLSRSVAQHPKNTAAITAKSRAN
jgi:Ca-activated chloride channel homolog